MNLERKANGKRLLASKDSSLIELKKVLPILFKCLDDSVTQATEMLSGIDPKFFCRGMFATSLQSILTQELYLSFEENVKFGKQKRAVLLINNYAILFKKFNSKGMPMNIASVNNDKILNQSSQGNLFNDTDYQYEPIMHFGYQQNKFGYIVNPQLIYIDDGKVQFRITKDDLNDQLDDTFNINITPSPTSNGPKVKDQKIKIKKAQ